MLRIKTFFAHTMKKIEEDANSWLEEMGAEIQIIQMVQCGLPRGQAIDSDVGLTFLYKTK